MSVKVNWVNQMAMSPMAGMAIMTAMPPTLRIRVISREVIPTKSRLAVWKGMAMAFSSSTARFPCSS